MRSSRDWSQHEEAIKAVLPDSSDAADILVDDELLHTVLANQATGELQLCGKVQLFAGNTGVIYRSVLFVVSILFDF